MEPWEGIVSIPEGGINDYKIRHFFRPPGKIPCTGWEQWWRLVCEGKVKLKEVSVSAQ